MFRLALALGRTVAELEQSMTCAEFSEWQAYYVLEPFGAWRDNWHSAQIASLIYNTNRGRSPPVKMSEYMYQDPQTVQDAADAETLAWLSAKARKTDGD